MRQSVLFTASVTKTYVPILFYIQIRTLVKRSAGLVKYFWRPNDHPLPEGADQSGKPSPEGRGVIGGAEESLISNCRVYGDLSSICTRKTAAGSVVQTMSSSKIFLGRDAPLSSSFMLRDRGSVLYPNPTGLSMVQNCLGNTY